MKNTFVSKIDLAQAYFPYIEEVSARHKLRLLMKENKRLMEKLAETGYNEKSHAFSPVQTQIIFECLGNPFRPSLTQDPL